MPRSKVKTNTTAKKPEEPYNWINPTRPATDEEFEQMIIEAENSPSISAKEARKYTMSLLKKWSKKV